MMKNTYLNENKMFTNKVRHSIRNGGRESLEGEEEKEWACRREFRESGISGNA